MTDDNDTIPDGGATTADPAEPRDGAGADPSSGRNPEGSTAEDGGPVDPDEFFVTRGEDGELLPVDTHAEGYGEVTVRPMTYGRAESLFGDAGSVAQVGPAILAEAIRDHVLDPDLEAYARSNYREQVDKHGRGDGAPSGSYFCGYVIREEMEPLAPQALLMAVLRESGMSADVTVGEDGSAEIQFDDEGN